MDFEYRLTEDEFFRGMQYLRNQIKLVTIIVLIFIAYSLVSFYFDRSVITLFSSLLFSGIFYFFSRYSIKTRMRKSFKEHKTYAHRLRFHLSDEGVDIEHNIGKSTLDWSAFDRFIQRDSLCILYTAKYCGHIIPLRIFSDEEQVEFFSILTKNIKTDA